MVLADSGHDGSPSLDKLSTMQSGELHDVHAPSGGNLEQNQRKPDVRCLVT